MNIEVFEGNNHYLSNMYRLENGLVVAPEGIVVPTAEHAYQAAKFEASSGEGSCYLVDNPLGRRRDGS